MSTDDSFSRVNLRIPTGTVSGPDWMQSAPVKVNVVSGAAAVVVVGGAVVVGVDEVAVVVGGTVVGVASGAAAEAVVSAGSPHAETTRAMNKRAIRPGPLIANLR
jgi:hypothetical protein